MTASFPEISLRDDLQCTNCTSSSCSGHRERERRTDICDGLLSRVDLTCGYYMYVDGGGSYMCVALFNAQHVKTAE